MKWPWQWHFHDDPHWQRIGCNAYYVCSCGARRVRELYSNMASPVRPGFPRLVDSHGMHVTDTGWRTTRGE
jgi:hypothetical protein